MEKLSFDAFHEPLTKTLSRRAALARLAGGATAATLSITGRREALGSSALATPIAPSGPAPPAPAGTEILWDTWGVPHVFANDAPGLFYGFGWAQAHAHGDLLLRLYAQARGRAAEVFGEDFLVSDRAVRTMGLHTRGELWYQAQSSDFRANLDAFAAGVNAYAQRYPERLADAGRMVLPVAGVDATAHIARILYLFLAGDSGVLQFYPSGSLTGSNGWAIAPARTAGGNALLLANPHLLWADEHTWLEAQLSAPGVYDAYGVSLVGVPVLEIAFNDYLGWTHTNNTIDPGDVYRLTLDGDGYRFDGQTRDFETRTETFKVRQDDGTLREESLEVRRSVHGPVVETTEGQTVAIRLAGVDEWSSSAGTLEQWWDMGRARDLAGFESVVRRLQLPYFTIIYADRDGHILSLFNGHAPVRPPGEIDWSQPVPGDTSATLWTEIHPYDDLPKVTDPPGGWVQNSNSPPWYTTYPLALNPDDYPPDLAPRWLAWRERRGIRMLEENPSISLERLVELKYSTRMELADRVLDELIAAARQSGDATAMEAADVLAAWDRQALPTSTGALLFAFWVQAMQPSDRLTLSDLFSTPWDPGDPLTTPRGLKDPDKAVQALTATAVQLQEQFGRLDVPWGEVARLQRGSVDLPANGFEGDPFGVFRVLFFDYSTLETSKRVTSVGGDTYVAAVEFSDPVRARVLMTYGNASQPGSPHIGDQLKLSAKGETRPAWRTRAEIEANLEAQEQLG